MPFVLLMTPLGTATSRRTTTITTRPWTPVIDETRERTEIDRQLIGLCHEYDTKRTEAEEQAVEDGAMVGEVFQLETVCSACQQEGKLMMHA